MKKIFFAAIAAMFVSVFCACGNSSEKESKESVVEETAFRGTRVMETTDTGIVWHDAYLVETESGWVMLSEAPDDTVGAFIVKTIR